MEKTLQLWDDERFAKQLQTMAHLDPLLNILRVNEETYWNEEIKGDFGKVLALYVNS